MTPKSPEPIFEVSGEFIPEEQLALAQEFAAGAQTPVVPHRQNKMSGVVGSAILWSN